jgi:serine/threonine protein kinase
MMTDGISLRNAASSGDVKIFDFGLAKELDPSLRHGCTEYYELSGNTGSLRYMSPEVARSEPYNLTADVYSFGLLLWQVCSLGLPYDGMNRQDHSELVVHGNERPPLDSSWSTPLRILMKRAWEPDPGVRPSMDSIYKILKREICSLRDGDDSGLEHFNRRSTFVLNRDSMANPMGNHEDLRRRAMMKNGMGDLVKCSSSNRLLNFGVERQPSESPMVG